MPEKIYHLGLIINSLLILIYLSLCDARIESAHSLGMSISRIREMFTGKYGKSRIVILVNVGLKGKMGLTFFGQDDETGERGNNFAVLVYEFANNTLYYGDYLGWPAPNRIFDTVKTMIEAVCGDIIARSCSFVMCHDSTL